MIMKYYTDVDGNYLGGSDNKPLSSYETPYAPEDASMIWDGSQFNAPPVPSPTLNELKTAKGRELEEEYNVRLLAVDEDLTSEVIVAIKLIWTSLVAQAKDANPIIGNLLAITQIMKAIKAEIKALTVEQDVIDYDVTDQTKWEVVA